MAQEHGEFSLKPMRKEANSVSLRSSCQRGMHDSRSIVTSANTIARVRAGKAYTIDNKPVRYRGYRPGGERVLRRQDKAGSRGMGAAIPAESTSCRNDDETTTPQ
ncbi:hypothetical protein MasN3_25680 [Massilia varians]|uniref:Uncharacterized protein n=1 Tax=Massilia varians TaxID=457921 RepID=A0ABN6TGJ4_9BURK|nr:hypothetical protein MasN3_25680 [Massilia varians]